MYNMYIVYIPGDLYNPEIMCNLYFFNGTNMYIKVLEEIFVNPYTYYAN